MPYRRLPNTDIGRLRALQTLHTQLQKEPDKALLLGISLSDLQVRIDKFKHTYHLYSHQTATERTYNQKAQKIFKETKMYVSHFIQVMQLCILRGEIKRELKALYGLPVKNDVIPKIVSYEDALEWAERVMSGENLRKIQGGTPIYNPSVANINVLYSQLKEIFQSLQTHRKRIQQLRQEIEKSRNIADSIIKHAWNAIENHFSSLQGEVFYTTCKRWGVVYYLRKNEQAPSIHTSTN